MTLAKTRLLLFFLLMAAGLSAQEYNKQVGIRLGLTSGLTGKVIKDDRTAIEASMGFRTGGLQMYFLLESYHPVIKTNTAHWMFYFGGGAHLGYVNGYDKIRRWSNSYGYYMDEYFISGTVIGLDGMIGTDYTFHKVPITLSLELKPYFELQAFKVAKANFWDFGLGIAYRF
jgi:hypothetical protein